MNVSLFYGYKVLERSINILGNRLWGGFVYPVSQIVKGKNARHKIRKHDSAKVYNDLEKVNDHPLALSCKGNFLNYG